MKFERNKSGRLKIVFSWTVNSSVNIPIIFSFLGFFIAALLFLPRGCGTKYYDLKLINKKEIVDTFLTRKVKKQKSLFDSLTKYVTLKDTTPQKDSFNKVKAVLRQTSTELYQLRNSNIDTNLKYYVKYLSLDRDTLYNSLVRLKDTGAILPIKLPVTRQDSPVFIHDLTLLDTQILQINKVDYKFVKYVADYPSFGLWYLLSIGQMSLWFLLFALIIGSILKTKDILPSYPYNLHNAIIPMILPFITIGLFVLLFYNFIVDEHVIVDKYFLNGFTDKMMVYSIPGYAVAIFCFSTYLFLSNKLELLDTIDNSNDEEAKKERKPEDYKRLKAAFDFSFLCSAIILSLFVFYLGILFNATNQLEAMRFYSLISGKPFISYDYVYLVGIMHTILLLIFYIPVRIRFNSLQMTKDEKALKNNQDDKSPGKKYFRILWESLGSILLTVSPLLATLVEKIVSALLQ